MAYARVYIFNVYHGLCALVKAPNGYGYMIDCGRSASFSPARYVQDHAGLASPSTSYPLAQLLVSHPHDDHIEDIKNIRSFLAPSRLLREPSYDWDDIKTGNDPEGYENLDEYVEFQTTYTAKADPLDWAGVTFDAGPWLSPEDAIGLEGSVVNNSSIPLFVEYAGVRFLFPGDLEKAGWETLLAKESFKKKLGSGVTFFVASHHGHDSGFLSDVFDAMGDPVLNIIKHDDENACAEYSKRATGMSINGQDRKSLTTRRDGTIVIDVMDNGTYSVQLVSLQDNE